MDPCHGKVLAANEPVCEIPQQHQTNAEGVTSAIIRPVVQRLKAMKILLIQPPVQGKALETLFTIILF